jgi:CubicO group peptidase (beta-lactamase class C family)
MQVQRPKPIRLTCRVRCALATHRRGARGGVPKRTPPYEDIVSALAVIALLLLAPAASIAQTVPGAAWATTTPQEAGWSPDLVARANEYADGIGTATLLVVQHGVIVDSLGTTSNRLELHSVRKSLLSALIGIAVGERRIGLDQTLAQLGIDDVPPPLTPEEKQATVQDLLESRSGVYHVALYETDGERLHRPARGSHPSGTFWYYNNWDFNALGAIYEHATGQSIFAAFQSRIAQPIGMQDYRPFDGRYVIGSQSAIPAYPFHMSARDLARFGLLYLHGGQWNGRQIVPASWVSESTTPRSVTSIPSGYAYLWWTALPGQGVPDMALPPGAFWADGAGGQLVVVDPADDLVVVHQTNGTRVRRREFGHIMWLIRQAAHAPNPGPDPAEPLMR